MYTWEIQHQLKKYNWIENSSGSLGSGNHFIEIDSSEIGEKYLVIHTGSRNLGVQVAEYYQDWANQICIYNLIEYKTKLEKALSNTRPLEEYEYINR